MRLHPYLTDRMLANVEPLRGARELAARHHERLDGSGYPRGLTAVALTSADRILAAADVYHALSESRPHRPARTPDEAAAELRAEAKAGRLDGDAINAVLRAAGHRAPVRRDWPAGSRPARSRCSACSRARRLEQGDREKLVVAPKTVSNHVEHIYAKIGVSTRAAAAIFAMQHGLVGSYEPGRAA